MSTTEDYRRFGVPTTLLSLSHNSWTRANIRLILDYYRWKYEATTRTKMKLMHELHLLVQEYDLDFLDRWEIFNAHKSGSPLPRRKPRVRRVPRPAFPDCKATARRHISYILETPRPEVANALPRDCVVCFETLSPQNTPKRKVTSLCNHEPDVCNSCLAISISTQFNSKVWDQIDCPTCDQRLGFQDVKTFADSPVFERYDNHSLQACLSDGHFQRCRHPNCQFGQQCFPDADSYMICVECRGRTCITCDTIWHPSETCADVAGRRAEAQRTEEEAATQYLTKNVKLCPRCNVRGEKVSGCDHMTCPQCHYQYCWVCLVDYAEILRHGNTGHQSDCRYHSNNLPGAPGHETWAVAQAAAAAPTIATPQGALLFIEDAEDLAMGDMIMGNVDVIFNPITGEVFQA